MTFGLNFKFFLIISFSFFSVSTSLCPPPASGPSRASAEAVDPVLPESRAWSVDSLRQACSYAWQNPRDASSHAIQALSKPRNLAVAGGVVAAPFLFWSYPLAMTGGAACVGAYMVGEKGALKVIGGQESARRISEIEAEERRLESEARGTAASRYVGQTMRGVGAEVSAGMRELSEDIAESDENVYKNPSKAVKRIIKDSPFLVNVFKDTFRRVYGRFCYYAKHPSELLYKKEPRLLIAWIAGATCVIMSMGLAPKIVFRQIEKSLDQPKIVFKTDQARAMGPIKLVFPMLASMSFLVWKMIGAGKGFVLDKELKDKIESSKKRNEEGEKLTPFQQRLKKYEAGIDFFGGAAMGAGVFGLAYFLQNFVIKMYDGIKAEPKLIFKRDFVAPDEPTAARIIDYIEKKKALRRAGQACTDMIFLYGPKGTGKTELSKMLAGELGYGWAIVNSGSITSTKDVSGELLKLIAWAKKNDIVLIFDECGDYLGPRAEQSTSGLIFKNTFCQLCGTLKDRPMTILVDNNENDLDGKVIDKGGRISFRQRLEAPKGLAAGKIFERLVKAKIREIKHGKKKVVIRIDYQLVEHGIDNLVSELIGAENRLAIRDLQAWADLAIQHTLCRPGIHALDKDSIKASYYAFMDAVGGDRETLQVAKGAA